MSPVKSGFTLIESLVAVSLFVIAVTSATSLFVVYTRAQRESGLRQKAIYQLNLDLEKIARDIRLKKVNFKDTTTGFRTSGTDLYTLDNATLLDNATDGVSANPNGTYIIGAELELGVKTDLNAEEIYFYDINGTGGFICSAYLNTPKILYKYSNGRCDPVFRIDNITVEDVKFYIHPDYNPYPQADSDCKDTTAGTFNGYYCSCTTNANCFSGKCSGASPGVKDGICLEYQPAVTISVTASIANSSNITLQTTVSSRRYVP